MKEKTDPVMTTVNAFADYLTHHNRKPKDVLRALDILVNRYVREGECDGVPMGPLTRFVLEAVRKRLLEARKEHARLSKAFAELKPLCGAENARKKMGELCKEMQDVWEPFREFIGPCPDCSMTRIAGTDNIGDGFGCPQCGKLLRVSEAAVYNGKKR